MGTTNLRAERSRKLLNITELIYGFGMALVVEFEIHSYLSHSHIDHIGEAEEQSAHLGIAAKNRCWWRLGEV